MKKLRALLCLLLLGSIYLSCTKDKTPVVVLPTATDTISKIIDSIVGNYRVFVTKDSFDLSPIMSDTLGFDTIVVSRINNYAIFTLSYYLRFSVEQSLAGSEFLFEAIHADPMPGENQTAIFFLNSDSIEIRDGWFGDFEWGNYLFYRGKKISP